MFDFPDATRPTSRSNQDKSGSKENFNFCLK